MKELWKEYKLGEIAEYTPTIKLEKGNVYARIEMEEVEPSSRFITTNKTIIFDGDGGSRFKDGDILFARISPCLENRKIGQAKIPQYGFGVGSTEFFVLRAKIGFDHTFLLYLMRSEYIVQSAVNSMVGASGRQRADWNFIKKLKLNLPPLSIQQKIADILGKYDALIDNCEQQINILENTAREIYREWFVRGRCPFENTSGISKKLCKVVEIKNGKENIFSDSNDALFNVYGSNGIIGKSKNYNYENVIVIGRVGAYCGSTELTLKKIWATDNTLVIIPKFENQLFFFFYTFKYLDLRNYASGSAQPLLTQGIINQLEISCPNNNSIANFDKLVSPIFNKIENLQNQITTLRTTRDKLLPRLLSGQLNIEQQSNT